ncbi:hypothetical protein AOLI_G00049910 [Acnodon oligacanthus]
MASQADKPKGTDSLNGPTVSPENQCQQDVEALGATVDDVEDRIALCDMVLSDLRAIRKIVQEKCFRDAAFQEQDK